jgi:2-phosphoglycerate kinase
MILIITSDEEQHKRQFFEHRENDQINIEEFRATRIIQDFLINEAKSLNIEIMENEKP